MTTPAEESVPAAFNTWSVEWQGVDAWLVASIGYSTRDAALVCLARRRERFPDRTYRLVRETTTYTVEDET